MSDQEYKLNSDKSVAVATDNYWIPIDKNTPRNVKIQLLSRFGVAMYGHYHDGDTSVTHWYPLPRRRVE